MIPDAFWDEIESFKHYYITVSGGYHSTYTACQFKDRNIPATLFHNNTYLRMKSSENTLDKLKEYTQFPFVETEPRFTKKYPNFKSLMRTSFNRVQEAIYKRKIGKYHKKIFPCCRILKESPANYYIKNYIKDKENSLIITSIMWYEGKHRRITLAQLRKKDTFLMYHKTKDIHFAYALRDTKKADVEIYIHNLDWDVQHSGCRQCPVLLVHEKSQQCEQERLLATERLRNRLLACVGD